MIAREAALLGRGDAVIALIEGERGLRIAGWHGERARAVLGQPPTLAGTPVSTLLLASGPLTIDVPTDDGPARALVVPLAAGERTMGGLIVVKAEGTWSEEDATLLATFGRRAAVALAKSRARDAEGRRAGQLAILSAASEIAASTLDVDVAARLDRALPAALVRLLQRRRLPGGAGGALLHHGRRRRHDGDAAAEGTPRAVRHAASSAGWPSTASTCWPATCGASRASAAPGARRRCRSWRCRCAWWARWSPSSTSRATALDAFDEGDVVAVDGIAAQVASAIRNARLFEEKVRALRSLEILQEITNVLNSDLDLDALIGRIARRSVEAVRAGADGRGAALPRGRPGGARRATATRTPRRWRRVRLGFHEGLPGSVFVSGQGRLVRCAPEDYARPRGRLPRRPRAAPAARAPCACRSSLPQEKLGVLLLESAAAPGRVRRRATSASPPRSRTRPRSRSATRCACAASWRWTASARTSSRTSATSCARRSP